jgi:hypothetical protein
LRLNPAKFEAAEGVRRGVLLKESRFFGEEGRVRAERGQWGARMGEVLNFEGKLDWR